MGIARSQVRVKKDKPESEHVLVGTTGHGTEERANE